MDAESFNELALRVIAGETTDAERRELDAELSATPARREEFDQLRITLDVLRTTAPMAEAARATGTEFPAHRRNELLTAVRQHFGPEAARQNTGVRAGSFPSMLRWILAGGGVTAMAAVVVVFTVFSNTAAPVVDSRTVEVGLYSSDMSLVRGDTPLSTSDIPAAKIVTFDQDAPFDQWKAQPLAPHENAKIWVDNENDLLHIVRRAADGSVVTETQRLLQGKDETETSNAQRDQIKKAVEALK